jgi:uncharacterized protein YjbJ (UPF0337 family)
MDWDRMKGAAKEVGGEIEETLGHAIGDDSVRASGVDRQFRGKAQNAFGQAKDGLRHVGDQVDAALDAAGGAAQRAIADGEQTARRAGRDISRHVEAQPLLSLTGAAAIGFMIGLFVRKF